ncbi:hypothetical protein E2C01_085773 [Portunus trituberculatus]|uniref:Uncharacterized protein n=1 Tax=Portunus trituberculatus TaxID=210409 RepID=A0A5B7JEK1_PORTR|nr:hypothetical protein [Portunus trituberculatus]
MLRSRSSSRCVCISPPSCFPPISPSQLSCSPLARHTGSRVSPLLPRPPPKKKKEKKG